MDQADGLAAGLADGLADGMASGLVTGVEGRVFSEGDGLPPLLLQAPTASAAATMSMASKVFKGASSWWWVDASTVGPDG
jgi:hypothetical protein